jgi:hypothetical protein
MPTDWFVDTASLGRGANVPAHEVLGPVGLLAAHFRARKHPIVFAVERRHEAIVGAIQIQLAERERGTGARGSS